MADAAQLLAEIGRLETALSNETLEVETDGQRVRYRSVAELVRAISYKKAALSKALGAPRTMMAVTTFTRN